MNTKIDRRKKYMLVVDIETTNDLVDNLAYDIGFVVTDKKGNLYEQGSYMVSEMFIEYKELLDSAYYKEKLPQYWTDYHNGKRKMASIFTIQRIIKDIIKKYDINEIWAYNCSFDKRGLNNTLRYITKSKYRWFFPFGMEYNCIWYLACQTIFQQKSFYKMALLNDWLSDCGNVKTNAEIGYNYINKSTDFVEEHQGLDDCIIESQILTKCLSIHTTKEKGIKPNCWQIVQKPFKAFKMGVENND